jgi:hypothetical protein
MRLRSTNPVKYSNLHSSNRIPAAENRVKEFGLTSAQYTDKKEKLSFPHILVNPDGSGYKVIY